MSLALVEFINNFDDLSNFVINLLFKNKYLFVSSSLNINQFQIFFSTKNLLDSSLSFVESSDSIDSDKSYFNLFSFSHSILFFSSFFSSLTV
ncbi:MAG: hypothetical protein Q8S84_04875 [bacterium]|nr:hypothetical protein [bacterium]